jgi:hypothetical protein
LRLAEHPDQRDVGQRIIGVTATDVGMDTGEPHLADLLIGDVTLLVRIEFRRRNDFFVPQLGMERGAFFIERQRLAGSHHACAIERVSGKFERHDPAADAARHLVDRQTVSGHRVPHPDEADVLDLAIVALVVLDRQQRVPNCPVPVLWMPGPQRMVTLAAILPVGGDRLLIEFGFIGSGHQALIENQADDHPDREGATTKAEAIDIVGLVRVVAAGELVDVDHVPLQAEAERAAENRPRLERRGADAVVVECDLVISRQVQRLEGAPDIRAPDLRRGIARTVRQQNNFSTHGIPRRAIEQFYNLWFHTIARLSRV